MQSTNLFVLTRSKTEFCTQYENVLANREHVNRIKDYEYETIVELVEELKGKGCQVSDFDGFYISFVIDYIGKEFDLLKIDRDNKVLNIELKSQKVDEEKIEKQLLRNQYYLRYLAPQIHLFTYLQKEWCMSILCDLLFQSRVNQIQVDEKGYTKSNALKIETIEEMQKRNKGCRKVMRKW